MELKLGVGWIYLYLILMFKLYLYGIEMQLIDEAERARQEFKLYLYGIEIGSVVFHTVSAMVQIVPLWN